MGKITKRPTATQRRRAKLLEELKRIEIYPGALFSVRVFYWRSMGPAVGVTFLLTCDKCGWEHTVETGGWLHEKANLQLAAELKKHTESNCKP